MFVWSQLYLGGEERVGGMDKSVTKPRSMCIWQEEREGENSVWRPVAYKQQQWQCLLIPFHSLGPLLPFHNFNIPICSDMVLYVHKPAENVKNQPLKMWMAQKELLCISGFSGLSHLVCGRPKFVPTPTRGRLWTTFLTVATSGKFNMTAAVERNRETSSYMFIFLIFTLPLNFW